MASSKQTLDCALLRIHAEAQQTIREQMREAPSDDEGDAMREASDIALESLRLFSQLVSTNSLGEARGVLRAALNAAKTKLEELEVGQEVEVSETRRSC